MREVRVGKKDSQRAKMYKPYIKWHHVLCFVEKREKQKYVVWLAPGGRNATQQRKAKFGA